jgi:hypothetical protein
VHAALIVEQLTSSAIIKLTPSTTSMQEKDFETRQDSRHSMCLQLILFFHRRVSVDVTIGEEQYRQEDHD